jgi:cytochrome c556
MRMIMLLVGSGLLSWAAFCQQQPPNQTEVPASTNQSTDDDVPKVTSEKTMSFWMAKKLELSKAILESLTTGDFDTMAKDAEQMQRLGRMEGLVRRNKDYQTQMQSFRLANQELIRHSKRKNVEGATLAFNQLTTSCVACHTMLREGLE